MGKGFCEYKSLGGKLLKISAECGKEDCRLVIAGDFFLYPEETVHALEASAARSAFLTPDSIQKQLDITLGLHQAQLYGMTTKEMAQTIAEAIARARKDALAAH